MEHLSSLTPRSSMDEAGHRTGIAVYRMEIGDLAGAQAELERLIPLERWHPWPAFAWAAPMLAEVAVCTGDHARSRLLYDYLLPFSGFTDIVGGYACVCHGPVDFSLGLLAEELGRPDEAQRYFASALAWSQRMNAPWDAARVGAHRRG